MDLSFVVLGQPQPQGSHRIVPVGKRHRITDSNEHLPDWRHSVTTGARIAMAGEGTWGGPLSGPVRLTVDFWLRRPLAAPKTRDVHPTRKPDTSKLIRAVEDACTDAGVWVDDAQVVSIRSIKRYAVGPSLARIYNPLYHHSSPCAIIHIEELLT